MPWLVSLECQSGRSIFMWKKEIPSHPTHFCVYSSECWPSTVVLHVSCLVSWGVWFPFWHRVRVCVFCLSPQLFAGIFPTSRVLAATSCTVCFRPYAKGASRKSASQSGNAKGDFSESVGFRSHCFFVILWHSCHDDTRYATKRRCLSKKTDHDCRTTRCCSEKISNQPLRTTKVTWLWPQNTTDYSLLVASCPVVKGVWTELTFCGSSSHRDWTWRLDVCSVLYSWPNGIEWLENCSLPA